MGAEIKTPHAALIIQNDLANRHSPVTIVAAMTSQVEGKRYPTEMLVTVAESGLSKDGIILLNQIRTIDKARLVKRLGKISDSAMVQVNSRLEISLGLVDL